MARPMRRWGSQNAQFRKRIPQDVLSAVRGLTLLIPLGRERAKHCVGPNATHVALSLRTSDKAETITRNANASAYLENVFAALRSDRPVSLTHRECVTLSGEWYHGWVSEEMSRRVNRSFAEHPEAAEEIWQALRTRMADGFESGETAREITPAVELFALGKGFRLDPASREMLIRECARALSDACNAQLNKASGDYSPDPNSRRFPEPSGSHVESITLDGLFKQWRTHPANKRRIAQATVRAYDRAFRALAGYLAKARGVPSNSIDCRTIKPHEIQSFADWRLEAASVATVNDGDLAALRSIFGWAIGRKLLSHNPAKDIRFRSEKRPKRVGGKALTDDEARAILSHAQTHKPKPNETKKMTAAKRWVPWLMAYTGTRVGEMAQLRKQDVRRHEGRWAIEVTPEAGTVKTGNAWLIPLHSHLIELGFIEFAQQAPSGHLFLTPNPKAYREDAPESRTKDARGIAGPLRALENRLREFAREVVTRPDVAPNHGWRHRFKAKGRNPKLGIQDAVLDAIQDHAPRTEGEGYGIDDLYGAMAEAIDRLPRYEID